VNDVDLPPARPVDLPERHLSLNQVVAYNMAVFRRAAGLNQDEFGEHLGGWSAASVSAAERSWDGKRVKKFDADEIIAITRTLGIPVAALLLPPEDDGVAFRYVLDLPGGEARPLKDLLPLIVGGVTDDSPAMDAYQGRLIAAGWRYRLIDESFSDAEVERRQARHQADRLLRQAGESALSIEQEALRRNRQALADLEAQREQLQKSVDGLRAFERDYRRRLQTFLEGQYRAFWTGVEGFDPDRLMATMRQQATEDGKANVTAVLLAEDGTFCVLQSDWVRDAEAGDEAESEAGEDG
jgi:vacuolar-type H+-ATPase subunit E/Vma4